MADRIGVQLRKELRRQCLRVLRQAQVGASEGWLSTRAVFNILNFGGRGLTLIEVQDALDYLADPKRDLIDTEDRRATKFDPRNPSYRLNANGLDLLDGNVAPVPGVEDDRV